MLLSVYPSFDCGNPMQPAFLLAITTKTSASITPAAPAIQTCCVTDGSFDQHSLNCPNERLLRGIDAENVSDIVYLKHCNHAHGFDHEPYESLSRREHSQELCCNLHQAYTECTNPAYDKIPNRPETLTKGQDQVSWLQIIMGYKIFIFFTTCLVC